MISLLAKEAVSGRGDSESDLARLRIKRGCRRCTQTKRNAHTCAVKTEDTNDDNSAQGQDNVLEVFRSCCCGGFKNVVSPPTH